VLAALALAVLGQGCVGRAIAQPVDAAPTVGVGQYEYAPQPFVPALPSGPSDFAFSGPYVGIKFISGMSDANAETGCVSPAGTFSASANCSEAINGGAFATNYPIDPSGVGVGLQYGYDIRDGNLVMGAVADMARTNISGDTSAATNLYPLFRPEFSSVEEKIEWLGTLRARIGFVTDNMLLYLTGGLAIGEVETSYDLSLPTAPTPVAASASDTTWKTGYTLGGGAEMSFGMFTISAEYLFFDLGSTELAPVATLGGVPQPTTYFPTSFNADGHLIQIGINFPLD
jgi:outer membrane immunogenic protein